MPAYTHPVNGKKERKIFGLRSSFLRLPPRQLDFQIDFTGTKLRFKD